VYRNTQ